MRVGDLNSP